MPLLAFEISGPGFHKITLVPPYGPHADRVERYWRKRGMQVSCMGQVHLHEW